MKPDTQIEASSMLKQLLAETADSHERAEFSAWSPTAESPANFHVPERFGYLEFEN